MAYTYELDSTDEQTRQIAEVRDEIDDITNAENPLEGENYFLTDERIKRRLVASAKIGRSSENVVKLAAAAALDTLATNQTYILKVGSTLAETRDGAKVGDSIRKHAESLRAQVKADETPTSTAPGTNKAKRRVSSSSPIRPTY